MASLGVDSLFGLPPITFDEETWKYTCPSRPDICLSLRRPKTADKNWALHADSIWIGGVHLADLLLGATMPSSYETIQLIRTLISPTSARVIELGAGAALPSLALAAGERRRSTPIVVTDYPDHSIISTIDHNAANNFVHGRVLTLRLDWKAPFSEDLKFECPFDVVLAADTIWNSDLHQDFLNVVEEVLRQGGHAILTAGLHTGRWTVQRFVEKLSARPTLRLSLFEEHLFRTDRDCETLETRVFNPELEEDEAERRKWVAVIVVTKL
jgi:nicotinamide N-methyltransferase